MTKKRSKRLSKSALDVIERRMNHFDNLAQEELMKGEETSNEKISAYLLQAQQSAVELAPYRHPRLQSATIESKSVHVVVRAPDMCKSAADWAATYVPEALRDESLSLPAVREGQVSGPNETTPADEAGRFLVTVNAGRYFSLRPRD